MLGIWSTVGLLPCDAWSSPLSSESSLWAMELRRSLYSSIASESYGGAEDGDQDGDGRANVDEDEQKKESLRFFVGGRTVTILAFELLLTKIEVAKGVEFFLGQK